MKSFQAANHPLLEFVFNGLTMFYFVFIIHVYNISMTILIQPHQSHLQHHQKIPNNHSK